ncbi:MAG: hypothetical protein JWQ25_1662, partial [Daejeonella sp.]|nr:hypothetical protein [Daejeonella sp.]
NMMGGAGMFAVSVYTYFMGGFYDRLVAEKLPTGADVATYIGAAPGTEMANLYAQATTAAGPDVIRATLVIPIVLSVAFAGLVFYMRSRKKQELHVKVA